MARFTVKAFHSCKDGEEWLNSLPSNFVLRAMTDTNAYITFAVEEIQYRAGQVSPQKNTEAQQKEGE